MDQTILIAALVFLLIVQAVLLATTTGAVGERELVAQRLQLVHHTALGQALRADFRSCVDADTVASPSWTRSWRAWISRTGCRANCSRPGCRCARGEFLFVQLVADHDRRPGRRPGWLGAVWWRDCRAAVRRRWVRRCRWSGCACAWIDVETAFEQGLPDALDRVTGALRAGLRARVRLRHRGAREHRTVRRGVRPDSARAEPGRRSGGGAGALDRSRRKRGRAPAGDRRRRAAPHRRQPDRSAGADEPDAPRARTTAPRRARHHHRARASRATWSPCCRS